MTRAGELLGHPVFVDDSLGPEIHVGTTAWRTLVGTHTVTVFSSRLHLSPCEIAEAVPLPSMPGDASGLQLLRFERNAYRDRCHALERMIAYLTSREPDTATLDREVKANAEREADLIAALNRIADRLPAAHN